VLAHHDPQQCQVLGLKANAGLEGAEFAIYRDGFGATPVQKKPVAPEQSTTFACTHGKTPYIKILDTCGIEVKFQRYTYEMRVPVDDGQLADGRETARLCAGGGQRQAPQQFIQQQAPPMQQHHLHKNWQQQHHMLPAMYQPDLQQQQQYQWQMRQMQQPSLQQHPPSSMQQ